jgi:hypothetical protein
MYFVMKVSRGLTKDSLREFERLNPRIMEAVELIGGAAGAETDPAFEERLIPLVFHKTGSLKNRHCSTSDSSRTTKQPRKRKKTKRNRRIKGKMMCIM